MNLHLGVIGNQSQWMVWAFRKNVWGMLIKTKFDGRSARSTRLEAYLLPDARVRRLTGWLTYFLIH
jgi:hypothetical protein